MRRRRDVVAASLDGLALDQVDRPAKQCLQGLLEVREGGQVVARRRLESHEEVGIAAHRIEAGVAGSRAENLQPRHTMPEAERGEIGTPVGNGGMHGGPLDVDTHMPPQRGSRQGPGRQSSATHE